MKKLIGVIILVVLIFGLIFIYALRSDKPSKGYNSRQDCEKANGQGCSISLGADVLPKDKKVREEFLKCMSQIPSGWHPDSVVKDWPKCEWKE